MATTFQRARSDEQRAIRRRTILDTAAAMLEEAPVADLSLNELSRRVGLAKSNVLRYFDSREAVLLELLDSLTTEWIYQLAKELPAAVDASAKFERRAEQLAGVLSRSLADRPAMCDLLSAQAAVLEHNVSVETITSFKLRGLASAKALAGLIQDSLPELSEDQAWSLIVGLLLIASATWSHAHPPQPLLDAYEADSELAALRMEFVPTLESYLISLAIGLEARGGKRA